MSARGIATQWAGVLAGPIAWALDLTIGYSRVKEACGTPWMWALHVMTLAALVIIALGAWAAWTALRATPDDAPTDGGRVIDRSRFLAILGLLSCSYFALVVIATSIPRWMQSNVCQ